MKKWSEIKQATLNKLFLTEPEARQQGYLEHFNYLANECLNFIANGVKPRIGVYEVLHTDLSQYTNVIEGTDFVYSDGKITYNNGDEIIELTPTDDMIFKVSDYQQYIIYNGALCLVTTQDGVTKMPDDFLSFSGMINYLDGVENPKIVYITDNIIALPEIGIYNLYYNALWHEITKDDIEQDLVLDIDYSILNCLPTYMASQLLSQDDIQRSTILKNEFELMLSRLDTNIMYESDHFESSGGWY